MSEYFKRTLIQKLGYKSNQKALVLKAPDVYWKLLTGLPEDLTIHSRRGKGPYDFIHLFLKTEAELSDHIAKIIGLLKPTGVLWISWPKKSSSIYSDINRDIIREYLLAHTKLVDCKVAAINEDWSGLKFMVRKVHRY